MKKIFFLIMLLVSVLAVSSCSPKCPSTCGEPGSYSACDDNAVKTRSNYRCSEATEYQCESYVEEKQCAKEIKMSPAVGDLSGFVKPSIDNKVKGTVTIEISTFPEDTKIVAYYLEGGDLEPIGQGRMPGFASKQGDVWIGMIDTTEYENGAYQLAVVSNNQEAMEGNPKAMTTAWLDIEN